MMLAERSFRVSLPLASQRKMKTPRSERRSRTLGSQKSRLQSTGGFLVPGEYAPMVVKAPAERFLLQPLTPLSKLNLKTVLGERLFRPLESIHASSLHSTGGCLIRGEYKPMAGTVPVEMFLLEYLTRLAERSLKTGERRFRTLGSFQKSRLQRLGDALILGDVHGEGQ